jgi:hypothetical protein
MQHTVEKISTRATTLLLTSSQSGVYTQNYGGPKVARVPTLGISGVPFGRPGTKCHLDAGLVTNHKVYYKGESGGFPQVQIVVSLVSPNLPMAHINIKSVQIMH